MAVIKVAEASDVVLDCMVAKAESLDWFMRKAYFGPAYRYAVFTHPGGLFDPTKNWGIGGPIIEREGIQWCKLNGQIEAWSGFDYLEWRRDWDSIIRMGEGSGFGTGPTILIAAMRCYVASKLGDEVEAPDELIGT